MGESKVRGGKIRFGLSLWGGLGGAGNGNRNRIGVLIGGRKDTVVLLGYNSWGSIYGYDYANLFLSKLERFSCDSDSCSVSLYSLYTFASQPVYASYVYKNFLRRSDR